MSLEDFQLLDKEPFDNSIIKRDFTKIYHQQGAQLNQSDQNIEFIFGENNNYHQIGIGYLEFNITVRKKRYYKFPCRRSYKISKQWLCFLFQRSSFKYYYWK